MEEKQFMFCCTFASFLIAYCGTTNRKEQFDIAKDALIGADDCYITEYELQSYYNEFVTIHICPLKGMGEKYAELELQFIIPNILIFSCDCIDIDKLIIDCYNASKLLQKY